MVDGIFWDAGERLRGVVCPSCGRRVGSTSGDGFGGCISRILGRRANGHLRNDGLLRGGCLRSLLRILLLILSRSLYGLPRNTLLSSYRLTVRRILLCILLLILVRVLMFERVDDARFQTLKTDLGTHPVHRPVNAVLTLGSFNNPVVTR